MEIGTLNALMNSNEPLLPELEPYLYVDEVLGMRVFHHPLVIDVPFTSAALINARYQFKKEKREEYVRAGNYAAAVGLTERPYRLEYFMSFMDEIAGTKQFFELAASIWVDSENIYRHLDDWREIWAQVTPSNRKWLHEEREWQALQGLPERFEVYRGIGVDGAEQGLSWTTCADKARWFANRNADLVRSELDAEPVVLTGIVNKTDVIAHFVERGEREVVVLPEKVESVRREAL